MKLKGFYTSTIGSFPLEDSKENRERCLKDLINLGIDFPAYPQLIEMGKQFLEDFVNQDSGIIIENGKYELKNEEIKQISKPPGLEPFLWTIKYIKDKKLNIKIKAPITGPFTLASYIKIKEGDSIFNTALSNIDLIEQIAYALAKSCEIFSKEASMISIDEPILSIIIGKKIIFKYDEEDIIRILNYLKNKCGNTIVGIHVCGRISQKLANILLNTNLDFLSHEFHDSPENIKIYNPKEVKENNKILSIGCVSSKNQKIESIQEILNLIMKFKDYNDCLIFTPDCGFKNLIVEGSNEIGYKIAIKKLKNMVKAISKYKEIIE